MFLECILPLSSYETCTPASSVLSLAVLEEEKPEVYVYATVEEVKDFLDIFNGDYVNTVQIQWLGPIEVGTDIILQLGNTDEILTPEQQEYLANVLIDRIKQVSNVEITGAWVVVQHVQESENTEGRRALQPELPQRANSVSIRVTGRCERGCKNKDFEVAYNEALREALPDMLHDLQTNPSIVMDYFQDVSITLVDSFVGDIAKDIPVLAEFDDPVAEEDFPYWIFGLLGAIIVVLLLAIAYGWYQRKQRTTAVDQDSRPILEEQEEIQQKE